MKVFFHLKAKQGSNRRAAENSCPSNNMQIGSLAIEVVRTLLVSSNEGLC